jgi:proline dehydrogenase
MSVMRSVLLAGSTNAWLRDRATKYGFVRRSVERFMPGEQIEDALRAARELQGERLTSILTRLGENITSAAEADEVTRHYLEVIDKAAAAGLDAQISIKPTQLGLDLDRAMCERNLDLIVERAERRGSFVWIDMESSPYVDPTLALFRRARAGTMRIGIALQAYLYRTARDVESLLPLGPAIRIVKGAYLEPAEIAYARKQDVDENFYRLCVRLLTPDAAPGTLLHIATHDAALVGRLASHIRISGRRVCPSRDTSSRCCSASSAACSSVWCATAGACGSSSATGKAGSRGTCGGLRSGRRTCGS